MLFTADAYGNAIPIAAKADPPTSHEAGAKHAASGKLGDHARIALDLVRLHPGKTYKELFTLASDADQKELHDAVELMRRLSGLKAAGFVRHGPARACTIGTRSCVTWEA